MNTIISILAGLGGVIAFAGAVYALIRGLVRQQSAVEENTAATRANTKALEKMDDRVDDMMGRLRSLEDWRRSGGRRW